MSDNYSKLIDITLGQTQGNMIINGIPQMQQCSVIACPECHNVLQAFNGVVPNMEVVKFINTDLQLKNTVHYCPNCGQKLHYPEIL